MQLQLVGNFTKMYRNGKKWSGKKKKKEGLITIPVIHPSVFAVFSDPQRTHCKVLHFEGILSYLNNCRNLTEFV